MTGADVLALPRQEPGAVEDLAETCSRVAAATDALAVALRGDRHRLTGCWAGLAAAACDDELAAVAALLRRIGHPVRVAAGLLRSHADEIRGARLAVAALRREYDDLVLVDRAAVAAAADLAAVRVRHQAVLERVAADAIATAARIRSVVADARVGGGTGAGRGGGGGGVGEETQLAARLPMLAAARALAGSGHLTPRTAPPRKVHAWWQLLTTDEQHRMVVRHAAALGAADGVPLAVRAAANELRLARDIARLSREPPPAGRPPWLLGTCLAVADALGHARAQRDPVTGRRLSASLLVYRPAAFGGQGRAAVAVGDVSRADNVAVLVPGLGSTVGAALRDLTATAARVTALARVTSPQESTATIAWTAYDAPNLLQVAGDTAAVTGARLLTSDLRAVRAAGGDAMHLTAVGHSYGSTTVGTALREHPAGVDDVVLLGSPGANVERAAALRVPAGHVWAGAASRDPVSYLDRFGADPSQEGFGATRFRAEDPARHPVMLSFGDHSRYFAPGSESLANVVRVVVGDLDAVSVATYRRETPWLPDGIAADPEADRPPAGTAGRSW